MRIAIGSDHAGYELKCQLVNYLQHNNVEVHDMGTFNQDSVDYPDYAVQVCQTLARDNSDFGILICYTGIGMCMAANKFKGIRAALVDNIDNAKLTREHNDANVLCMGAKDVDLELAKKIVNVFLSSRFLGGRHERTLSEMKKKKDNIIHDIKIYNIIMSNVWKLITFLLIGVLGGFLFEHYSKYKDFNYMLFSIVLFAIIGIIDFFVSKLQKLYRITEKKKNEKELKKDSDEQNEESAE